MRPVFRSGLLALSAVAVCVGDAVAQAAPDPLWISQFGYSGRILRVRAAASNPGGAFIAGEGLNQIILARYDTEGNQSWVRLFGSSEADYSRAAAPDGEGGVYIGGYTHGALAGPASLHGNAWLARYDGDGNRTWLRQFGTWQADWLLAMIPAESGGVFVAGDTTSDLGGPNAGSFDIFLARYDGDGNCVWITQAGSPAADAARGLSPDGAGGVFLAGSTLGSLAAPLTGLQDALLARFDGMGNLLWIIQFGETVSDYATRLASDGTGGVYVAGQSGLLSESMMFLARYDANANQLWRTEFGSTGDESITSLAPDGSGGVYVGGYTRGSLGGPNLGWGDAFLARYDAAGNRLWITQFGTTEDDEGWALAPDHAGGVYIAGDTRGSLGGPRIGNRDAFIARFPSGDPEPCYANCNGSIVEPILTVDDFICFINEFALAQGLPQAQQIEHYANCDGSTTVPVLTVDDFTCFIDAFAQGCP